MEVDVREHKASGTAIVVLNTERTQVSVGAWVCVRFLDPAINVKMTPDAGVVWSEEETAREVAWRMLLTQLSPEMLARHLVDVRDSGFALGRRDKEREVCKALGLSDG